MAQAQSVDARNPSNLQNNKLVTAKRMKRMSYLSRTQMLTGSKCSSMVQTALRMVVEPIFERDFATHSYGFRPNRGCKDALRRVQELLDAGYVHIVDADLKSYFDTIPKDRLKALVGQKVTDGRIQGLIESFLEQGVLDGPQEWTPEQGTPQGAVVAPRTQKITFGACRCGVYAGGRGTIAIV